MNSHPALNYISVEIGFVEEEYQEEFVLTQLQTAAGLFMLDKMSTVDIDHGELLDFLALAENIAAALEIPCLITDDVKALADEETEDKDE